MAVISKAHLLSKQSVGAVPGDVHGHMKFEMDKIVHFLFQRRAEKAPHSVALQFEQEIQVTYQQLNELCNVVARQLVCGRGSIIPICIDRSVNMVVSLLAVLKAGAAYVLLSPDSPVERNQFIIGDTKAPFVIVDSSTQHLFDDVPQILLEELLLNTPDQFHGYHHNLNLYQAPSDTAYVIYTSGTTGTPKGVLLSHQAAFTGLSALPVPTGSMPLKQLLCHSPIFSAAQRTILGTLSRGGTLYLASKESTTSGLLSTVTNLGIESLEITPSMLQLIKPDDLPASVKTITLGGEPAGPAIVDAWADKVQLFSGYGLSECTQLNMRSRIVPGQRRIILGKPSDSTTCYVLAPRTLSPVPVGVPGELCLGGLQLADGYLNLPDRTRKAFIPNPFGAGRLYRTGDMVILHEDGSMELMGRTDYQIKIDGQRVEPNESNALIQLHPGVAKSSVVPAQVFGHKALVAIVVPDGSVQWTKLTGSLRASLRSKINACAIPQYWVKQDDLPINPSGKTDIAKLIKLLESMTELELLSGATDGRLPTEEEELDPIVRQLVSEVLSLNVSSINGAATFQELGGTSLNAIVLASRLRAENYEVPVAEILQDVSLGSVFARRANAPSETSGPPEPFSLLPPDALSNLNLKDIEDAYPVTKFQEGVLADSLMETANYVYQRVYRIRGMSVKQVKAALDETVARNPILRTLVQPWKRTFIQVVKPAMNIPWKRLAKRDVNAVLRELAKAPMGVDDALLRTTVVGSEYLILEMHHSLFDFWSSQFVFADMVALLRGEKQTPRAPFSAYVAHHEKVSRDPATKRFWEEQLASAPESTLTLQKDEAGEDFVLQANLGDTLEEFCSKTGVTAGTAIHQAWAFTLAKHLEQSDVVFMTAFSGRDAAVDGILSLNGPTMCTVPFRADLRAITSMSAADHAKNLQKSLWTMAGHAHFGLRNITSATGIRNATINTMVNVLVKFEVEDADAPLSPVVTHGDNFTQYITIEMEASQPQSIKLLVPSSACVSREGGEVLLDTFTNVLKQIAQAPEASISDILDAKSQNKTNHDDSESLGLAHAAFELRAASDPSRTAIKTKQREISYGEFNARADSFARHLISCGVKVGEMIPVYMEKSEFTLVSIFGILKAGAAFVPLDPHNPYERNKFILGDISALRVITDGTNKEDCAAFGLPMIQLEDVESSEKTNAGAVSNSNVHVDGLSPDNIAYAIYTSGSTGLPKGVLVPHSAVDAATRGMVEATNVTAEWRALWVLNYIFDASYYDVFTLFSSGAALCVVPQDDLLADLAGHINDMGVEQVMLTPTITKLIRGGPAEVPRLKVLNVCGEKIDTNILQWAEHVDVYNGYGPTEATILMTVSKVLPGTNLNDIGHPLRLVSAVIVPAEGNSLQPVPHGTIGELCVRGPQLAKGYLNRPDNTAFVRDADGQPLYRTGDLARWSEDGSLQCFGRKDYQIKLNGFRIELGEIENAILHTGIVDAVVVSVAEINGKSQLVAFCIFAGDQAQSEHKPMPPNDRRQSAHDLMEGLTSIAHYMKPSLILPFHSFPTLPSGKANRKELVKMVQEMDRDSITSYLLLDNAASETAFVPVSSKEEKAMQQAWSIVLSQPLESIGASSVFLSLGGDSIAAINVAAECRRLSYGIPVGQLLANPSLAEQARHMKPLAKVETSKPVEFSVPKALELAIKNAGLDEDDIEDIYPCGPGQAEFLTQGKNQEQFWNLTVCRALPQDFDLDYWREVAEGLTAENQILRASYFQADNENPSSWYQVILRDPIMNWEEAEFSSEEEKAQLIKDLRESAFQFGKPNVEYLVLHSKLDGSRSLCVKVDHGTYDGTLLRIFDEQFQAIVKGETADEIEPFKNYIEWVAAQDNTSDLDYWRSVLFEYEPPSVLAPKRPVSDSLKFATVAANVDSVAEKFGVTASTVFQTVYSLVASRLTGSSDVLVDNLITGRNAEVAMPQRLNGTCANFLPSRTVLEDGSKMVSELFSDTQAAFWDSTEHGAVGLGDIWRAVGQDRATHSAKMLFCFQPFEPVVPGTTVNHMRWVVMAQSTVFMTINYALMVEVQKTATGHRLKMQWDSSIFDKTQIDTAVEMFEKVFSLLETGKDVKVGSLIKAIS